MPIYNPTVYNAFLETLFNQLSSNDGNMHITSNTHLTSDIFPVSLQIDSGVTLYTDNYRIYCLSSVSNEGTISNDGAPGNNGSVSAGGTAGTNPSNGTLYAGANAQDGVFNGSIGAGGSTKTLCIGTVGGTGGDAGAFAGGGSGTVTIPSWGLKYINELNNSFNPTDVISGNIIQLQPNSGAGSGAADTGTAGSGASGCGGGNLFIAAKTITNNGTISAQGGAAGDPHDDAATAVGGSGGGAGGNIVLFFNTIVQGTITVAGGVASLGVNGGDDGADGGVGNIMLLFAL